MIRAFRDSDAEQVFRLHTDTLHAINSKDYTPEQIKAWIGDASPEGWTKVLKDSLVALVYVDGIQIQGFGDIRKSGEIRRLYVHKDYQGKGIGSGLLRVLELTAKSEGLTEVRLSSTITGHSFYQSQGYEDVQATFKERGRQRLNCYIMRKRLT